MAFNLARYNINPFNVAAGSTRWMNAAGNEYVRASVGSALQIYAEAYGNERVDEEITGIPIRYVTAVGRENVDESAMGSQPTILLYPNFIENVSAVTDVMARIMPRVNFVETLEASAIPGSDVFFSANFVEEIDQETSIGGNTYISAEGFELISESASLEVIDTKACVLTTTLRPGERIVIDADSYTVLLNGENAIEIQSGDWIDELDRNTVDISLKAAAGVGYLAAHIVYTERYL